MTRISGKLTATPIWVAVILVSIAGLIGWLTSGAQTAVIAVAIASVICMTFEILRARRLFEAYHEEEKLVFVNRFFTLETTWKNVRDVRACAPEGEGDWVMSFHFIEPVSKRSSITIVGDGPDGQAREAEKAASILIEKFKKA